MQVSITCSKCNCDSTLESVQYEPNCCITLSGQLNLNTVTDDGQNSELVGAAQIVTARSKSASQDSRHDPNLSRAQVEQDCISLPNLDTVTNGIKPNAETNMEMSIVQKESSLIVQSAGRSSKWETHRMCELESHVPSADELERKKQMY